MTSLQFVNFGALKIRFFKMPPLVGYVLVLLALGVMACGPESPMEIELGDDACDVYEPGDFAEAGPYEVEKFGSEGLRGTNDLGRPVRVFAPTCSAEFPLLVFGHANIKDKCRLVDSYDSLLSHVASHGYVVVIVDHEDLSCVSPDDENITARAQSMIETREIVAGWNTLEGNPLEGRLDQTYFYFGHSRGAGAAIVATHLDDGPSGTVALQPISLRSYGYTELELKPFETLTVIAGNDSDLVYPYSEPGEEVLSGAYSTVVLDGALHTWTGDDIPRREEAMPGLDKETQQRVIRYLSAAFLTQLSTGDNEIRRPFYSPDLSKEVASLGATLSHRWVDHDAVVERIEFENVGATSEDYEAIEVVGTEEVSVVYTYTGSTSKPGARYRDATSLKIDVEETSTVVVSPLFDPAAQPGREFELQLHLRSDHDDSIEATRKQECSSNTESIRVGNRFQQVVAPFSAECRSLSLELSAGTYFIDDVMVVDMSRPTSD